MSSDSDEPQHTLEIIDTDSDIEEVITVPVSPIIVKKKKGFNKNGEPRKQIGKASEARQAALAKGRAKRMSNLQAKKDGIKEADLKAKLKAEVLQQMAIEEYESNKVAEAKKVKKAKAVKAKVKAAKKVSKPIPIPEPTPVVVEDPALTALKLKYAKMLG